MKNSISGRSPRGKHYPRSKESLRLNLASHPKLEALNRLHLPVVRAMKIRLRSTNVGMAHENLRGRQVVPMIQKGSGKGVPHYVRVNSFLDQSLFYHRFDQAVNCLGSQTPFLVRTIFLHCLEERMIWICSIPDCLQVILDGNKGFFVLYC